MTERIVINTGPLIALAKMQALEAIGKLPYKFVCPAEVESEITVGADQGYDVEIPEWVEVLHLGSVISPLAIASLDVGEAAVIQLAIEQNRATVCIDELKGRRAALAVGLSVVGSLGLIGNAKILGLVADVNPYIERARLGGIFYDDDLIATFLTSLNK